ncbi:MAG: cytidylate kinase-like family protein, partial [Deltaproteobacteria bacterium]|nr:cytidylate kinase-like family protein [Deltaproteobacteria bacterium]
MSIITISRGSYSRGKEVAEKVAQELNYECISRDILLEASEHFRIPEIKLARAIHDAPRILDRFSHGKQKYVAFIRAAILTYMKKNNIVYHGLAGHFFLQDIAHVLKERVIADLESRVKEEMRRENITAAEARKILKKDDDERRKWGMVLYGKDTGDPSLYDLVVRVKTKSVDDAVNLILHAAQFACFKPTPESQKKIEDMALAAEVKAALVSMAPDAETLATDGHAHVKVNAPA